jgi:hypothetical protein
MCYTFGFGLEGTECLYARTAISNDSDPLACDVYAEVVIPSVGYGTLELIKSRYIRSGGGGLRS